MLFQNLSQAQEAHPNHSAQCLYTYHHIRQTLIDLTYLETLLHYYFIFRGHMKTITIY